MYIGDVLRLLRVPRDGQDSCRQGGLSHLQEEPWIVRRRGSFLSALPAPRSPVSRPSILARTGSKSTNHDLKSAWAMASSASFIRRLSSILSSRVPRMWAMARCFEAFLQLSPPYPPTHVSPANRTICRRRDSNPHGYNPTVFKTVASAIPPLRLRSPQDLEPTGPGYSRSPRTTRSTLASPAPRDDPCETVLRRRPPP